MNIYDLELYELENYFLSKNDKKFRASQVYDWLYKKTVRSFDEMTNLKKNVIDDLTRDFTFKPLEVVTHQVSSDGTVKFLYRLEDGNIIEAVLMRHDYGNSLCVTTQVGCNMGCTFCASGLFGKKRNLTSGEIISQVIESERHLQERISHIVVMGIGEPFDNYRELMRFLRIVNHPKGLEIGARHITVSTSGIVPKILDYAEEGIQVNLAVSLHAPNDELRTQLMPVNKAYPLASLMKAIEVYIEKTNRRLTIEYILLKDVNDSKAHAVELANLLRGLNVYVNLIPYNEVKEMPYKRSNKDVMMAFYDTLKKYGINCTLRKEQGHDIDAACGQLRSNTLSKGGLE